MDFRVYGVDGVGPLGEIITGRADPALTFTARDSRRADVSGLRGREMQDLLKEARARLGKGFRASVTAVAETTRGVYRVMSEVPTDAAHCYQYLEGGAGTLLFTVEEYFDRGEGRWRPRVFGLRLRDAADVPLRVRDERPLARELGALWEAGDDEGVVARMTEMHSLLLP